MKDDITVLFGKSVYGKKKRGEQPDKQSDTFHVPFGGQVTVVAFGLSNTDQVNFELILSDEDIAKGCQCPPRTVKMPGVAQSVLLQVCGKPVVLTQKNPFVVIDAPQKVSMRALLEADNLEGVEVWLYNTKSSDLPEVMRGYSCGDMA